MKTKPISSEEWIKQYPITEKDDPIEIWQQSLATCPDTGMLIVQKYRAKSTKCVVVFERRYIKELVDSLVEEKWISKDQYKPLVANLESDMFSKCEDCGNSINFIMVDIKRGNVLEVKMACLQPQLLN